MFEHRQTEIRVPVCRCYLPNMPSTADYRQGQKWELLSVEQAARDGMNKGYERSDPTEERIIQNFDIDTERRDWFMFTTEIAQDVVDQLRQQLADLKKEQQTVWTEQGKLSARQAQEFYSMQKRLDEIANEVPLIEEILTLAQIDLLDARVAKAKRVIAELKPGFEEQQRKVQAEHQKLDAIGSQMRPHQLVLDTIGGDRGMLNIKLDNQRSARLRQRAIDQAPVMRSLQHMPRFS